MEEEYRQLERITKGFANHNRLKILNLLKKRPRLSVDEIAEELNIGYENASDHIRKLAQAGLVYKRHEGSMVLHTLTSRAEFVLVFCKKLK